MFHIIQLAHKGPHENTSTILKFYPSQLWTPTNKGVKLNGILLKLSGRYGEN